MNSGAAPLDLTAWRMWAYRAVWTQANVAGGAQVIDFTAGAGNTMIVLHAFGTNSGTNTLEIARVDEDNNDTGLFCSVVSGAATSGSVPRTPPAIGTNTVQVGSSHPLILTFSGAQEKFTIRQTGAGAQNDTLTIGIRALIRHSVLPGRDKSRSTNQADVSEATPTINRFVT